MTIKNRQKREPTQKHLENTLISETLQAIDFRQLGTTSDSIGNPYKISDYWGTSSLFLSPSLNISAITFARSNCNNNNNNKNFAAAKI